MARQEIDLTTPQPNGKMGEPTKAAWEKVNDMTEELYAGMYGSNMLINCGVPINQRNFMGGALAANTYGYDRWKAGTGGCNVTINQTTGIYTHTSGPLVQVIASPQFAWGRPLTFSVEDPTGNISVNVGGASGVITAGSGRRGVTITPTGSGNMTVQITASGVTYSRPKLERGSSASRFEYVDVAVETLSCKRFYQIDTNGVSRNGSTRMNLGVGLVFSATRVDVIYKYEFSMINPPTVTVTGAAGWRVLVGGGATTVSAISASEASRNSVYISATVSGRTPGDSAIIQSADGSTTAVGIIMDAEFY